MTVHGISSGTDSRLYTAIRQMRSDAHGHSRIGWDKVTATNSTKSPKGCEAVFCAKYPNQWPSLFPGGSNLCALPVGAFRLIGPVVFR